MKDTAQYTLLTNISFIQRKGEDLRLNCHALLFSEEAEGILGPHYSLRGFGTEAAWDVFMLWLDKDKHFPFALQYAEDRSKMMLSKGGRTKPIFSGNTLTLKDGTEFFLQSDDSSYPIDVYRQVGDITKVWEVLYQKTGDYWNAPYMPRLNYGPAPSYSNRSERAG